MRSKTLLLLGSLVPLVANGQTGLTNAEVFDYDLGDVVQSSYRYEGMQVGNWPRRYIRDSIIDIAYNVNGLEVEYTSMQHRFCLPGGPFPAEDTVEIVQFGYADGAAFPVHAYLGLNCDYYVPGYDEVEPWALFCDRDTWFQADFMPCDTCSCWEGNSIWYSRFVAGVGGPYYWRLPNEGWNDYAVQHDLVYFRKGAEVCGTEVVLGMAEARSQEGLVLWPNPVDDVLRWTTRDQRADVMVLDASGRELRRGKDAGFLVVDDLAPGTYHLLLRDAEGAHATRFVKR